MNAPRPFASLLPLALCACASVSHDALAPVQVLRREPLSCVVEAGRSSLPEGPADEQQPPDAQGPIVTLTLQLYGVDPELAEHLLGAQMSGLAAVVCARTNARALQAEFARLGERRVDSLGGPTKLSLHDGWCGSLALVNQSAYIGAYELLSTADSTIADPRIEVASEGVRLCASADHDPASGAISIDLELAISQLERPYPTVDLRVRRGGPPVTLQVPSGVLRRLATHSVLAPDEALVFGGGALPVDERGRTLVVVLEASLETPAPH